jgi:DNA (cytosine-5)-methyltransferase 1
MKYPYEWNLADGYIMPRNGHKVFSTFACGGGSTMGYKLAGYEMLGICEIDPQMARIYKKNHNPKMVFLEDIRVFRKREDLPLELFNLDILDGSPPCSSFSTAGNREKDWGKEKVFREGQAKQRLDDLFFEYIALVKRLRPKVAVAENVSGLLKGAAKGYVKEIQAAFNEAGYDLQVFLFNAASMGVPQKRQRSFFIARRSDLNLLPLKCNFDDKPITFGQVRREGDGQYMNPTQRDLTVWKNAKPTDKDYGDVNLRLLGKPSAFGAKFIHDYDVCNTIIASTGASLSLPHINRFLSVRELKCCGTYPQDYDFMDADPKYVIGMSVPPVMTARIAEQIQWQWLDKLEASNAG